MALYYFTTSIGRGSRKSLDLGLNRIRDTEAPALAKALESNFSPTSNNLGESLFRIIIQKSRKFDRSQLQT